MAAGWLWPYWLSPIDHLRSAYEFSLHSQLGELHMLVSSVRVLSLPS
jgi:hypothetical protein